MFLQSVLHAVTVLFQGGVQQPHPLLQTLQSVLHKGLVLSSTQSASSSTQKVSAQVYLPCHCLQLFIQALNRKFQVSNKASMFHSDDFLNCVVCLCCLCSVPLTSCVSSVCYLQICQLCLCIFRQQHRTREQLILHSIQPGGGC